MKTLISIFLLIVLGFNLSAQELTIPKRPWPARLVNVLTKEAFLSEEETEALEQKLVAYDDSTSTQITIVIVDDLNGLTANEYATEIGYQWGVGQKKKDNGIVILLSVGGSAGNRHYYISVGYGLEGVIPDLAIKRIQEKELLPYLKRGEYYKALDKTTTVLMQLASKEFSSDDYSSDFNIYDLLMFILVFGFIIGIIYFFSDKGESGGGGYSGGSGGFSNSSSSSGRSFGGFGGGSFGGGGAGGRW